MSLDISNTTKVEQMTPYSNWELTNKKSTSLLPKWPKSFSMDGTYNVSEKKEETCVSTNHMH